MKNKHQILRGGKLLGLLELLEKKEEKKRTNKDITRVLYPAKTAAGLCTRLA
jgi:hypothetical protein